VFQAAAKKFTTLFQKQDLHQRVVQKPEEANKKMIMGCESSDALAPFVRLLFFCSPDKDQQVHTMMMLQAAIISYHFVEVAVHFHFHDAALSSSVTPPSAAQ
jgi:hypothetical protein